MADLPITSRVFVRDSIGRFVERVGDAVDDAMAEAADYGLGQAVLMEPGLADTFYTFKDGKALYGYASAHPWALGLDQGIPEHFIPANMDDPRWPQGFLGNKSERFFATGPGVKHPGVTARRFMERSLAKVSARLPALLKKHQVRT